MVAAAMFALVATAQQTSFTVNDEQRHQTITVTAVDDDIVRVDVVPDGWTGQRLPSLALDRTPRGNVKVNNWEDFSMLRTENGLKVAWVNGSLTVGRGNDFYVTDLCNRTSSTVRLFHAGKESFYGAGERGYSFNLAGDTLINYNAQNYGYQMGEARTKQMGITMPMVISSKGYGIFFDDFCKSSLYLGDESIEYTSTSPQPLSYYIIDGNGRVENVVKTSPG